jgi:hypothetical protein
LVLEVIAMTIDFAGAGEKGLSRAVESSTEHHQDLHSRFMDDLQARFKPDPGQERYQPSPEYKNGLASQNLIGLEKWADDSKHCGAINQDQLASKLGEFAKKTDDMWHKMEENPKEFLAMSQDQWLTYPRFNKLFDQVDDAHRDKLLEALPWSLRAGE